ncbi:MAG: hypothetical protein ACRDR6_03025 [Pseudonocardiaceae bacterium]
MVNCDLGATATTELFGYFDDAHITNHALAGPDGEWHATSAREELRAWALRRQLRETSVLVSLTGVWNTFLHVARKRPSGGAEVPRYDTLSCAERKLILTADTCVTHVAALHDSDEMSLDDLPLTQVLSGYSDLRSDLRGGVPTNGLLIGVGLERYLGTREPKAHTKRYPVPCWPPRKPGLTRRGHSWWRGW